MVMDEQSWLYYLAAIAVFVWPMVAVVLAARLIYAGTAIAQPSNRSATVIRFAVAALLLLVILDVWQYHKGHPTPIAQE